MVKRLISLLLILVLALGGTSIVRALSPAPPVTPIIIVPGYGSPTLVRDPGTDAEVQIWKPDLRHIAGVALAGLADGIAAAGGLIAGNEDRMVKYAGNLILEATRGLNCNPDGSDVVPIAPLYTKPEESSYAYLTAHSGGKAITEQVLADGIVADVGEENLFYCYSDFRHGAKAGAENLRRYVEEVKTLTGAEKVRLVGVSYGGLVIGAYLRKWGAAGDLDNVVLTVPALGGAAFAYDSLSGIVHLDEELIANFVEYGEVTETQLHWLLRADSMKVLDPLCARLAVEYARQAILYWTSMWDLIPPQFYEKLKSELLDPVESAPLIAASDYIHNEVMAHYPEIFKSVRTAGGSVYIVAGTGHTSVTGLYENADGLLRTCDSTGALCAPMDERFADGYICAGTRCGDRTHRHLSPSREIDASTAYLPEQTWFIEDMFHGMGPKDPAFLELVHFLTYSTSPVDVRTDARYPQFEGSRNPTDTVYVRCDQSSYGYITAQDTALCVTNVSRKYPLKLLSVTTDKGVTFRTVDRPTLQPGESVLLPVGGMLPDEDNTGMNITVDYIQVGGKIPVFSKTFGFTICGGTPAAEGKGSVPAVSPATYASPILRLLDKLLSVLYLQGLLRIVYTCVAERLALR